MVNVKKILNTICLGYSKDFTKTHFQETVLFEDGTTKIMYATDTHLESGTTISGQLTEQRPYVARPVTNN